MHYSRLKKALNNCADTSLRTLLCAFVVISGISTTDAFAKGVAAGTDISNKAIVNYVINNNPQAPIESTPQGNSVPGLGNGQATQFTVDRKIDLVITGNNNANVTPGDTQSTVTFSLVNEGNDTQEFSLSTNSTLAGDNFDSSNCQTSVTQVKDGSGANVSGLSLPITGNITLAADYQASIAVKCDIPFNHNNQAIQAGQKALLALTATAVKNQDGTTVSQTTTTDDANKIDTVFIDAAGTDDSSRDASHSARRSYIATSSSILPTLSIKKTVASVQDPTGGNKPISGAVVTYKIIVNTSGNGVINNVIITDPTPSGLTYKKGSIYLNNINFTDEIDNDKVMFDTSNKISTINLGNITAGLQNEILLSYTIN